MTDELNRAIVALMLRDLDRRMPAASRDLIAILTAANAGWIDTSNSLIEEAVSDRPAAVALLVASLSFAVKCLAELARATDDDPGEILRRAAASIPD